MIKSRIKILGVIVGLANFLLIISHNTFNLDLFSIFINFFHFLVFTFVLICFFKPELISRYWKELTLFLFTLILCIGLLELCVGFILHHPTLSGSVGGVPNHLFKSIYWRERFILQYSPDCAMYDSYVSYRLKPGFCKFINNEFSTEYLINSQGLRDDESSLTNPDIIVLGDSVAMGWGVEQNETFSDIIEKNSNLKVLNTGISSYGTARELRLFGLLNYSRSHLIILSYCSNDYPENEQISKNISLSIMTNNTYQSLVYQNQLDSTYYPGLHLVNILKIVTNRLNIDLGISPEPIIIDRDKEPKYLIDTLIQSREIMKDKKLIILTGLCTLPDFAGRLKKEIVGGSYPRYINDSVILDFSKMNSDAYFVLDDHPNQKGHEIIASAIIQNIKNTTTIMNKLN